MHGLVDENSVPTQKATGFGSNMKWTKTAIRCSGHKGVRHAHLQGVAADGLTRTSKAAAYPRSMCQRMKIDIINYLQKINYLRLGKWPEHLKHFAVQHFYECIRCQLGKYCPKDEPHSFIPGECRYGHRGSMPPSRRKTPEPPPSKPADPLKLWKEWANRDNVDSVKIHDHTQPVLNEQQLHYLKKLLIDSVNGALELYREAIRSKIDYDHWIDYPVHVSLFKEIFSGHMVVRGIRMELHPWKLRDAQPLLAPESSYLRLPIRGHVKEWNLGPMDDLREMSHNQIYSDIDEDNWMVTIFGTEVEAVPAPSTPITRARKRPEERGFPRRDGGAAPSDVPLGQPDVRALPEQADDSLLQSAYEPAQEDQPGEEEFEARPHSELAPMRPNYNLRRVLLRIPALVEKGENEKAKRLLLGLHERLWHSPASDFTNLLRRAGMSGEVINLAREAVQQCAICRKYVRLPNRPQMRAKGAIAFNEAVQMDLFYWENRWFMLLVDEATRFKKCGTIEGQESEDLLKAMLELWIYHFGPPERLVLDQQVSLMSHEAGAEFERLSIERKPRGTTAGPAAQQHTGTGIVERHVQLVKLTMYKLRAELQRQGLQPADAEIAQESAMAQNLTLSYGGVTPAMAVYGTMPREFYNPDSEHIKNTTGAEDTDLSVFERALRIRQTALAQAQQAVIEDRVARAARTRPHQLEAGELVAGTTEVEFYREVKKDPGWRGPALLLRLDADEGVAIIQYQGKPYLVALRHVRTFRGIYHVEVQTPQMEDALWKLMKYVENMSEYKVYLYGWIRKRNSSWTRLPKDNDDAVNILAKAETVSKGLTKRTLHGVLFGRALRSMKPPAGTSGTLITWLHGGRSYAVQEHRSDNHLQTKRISNYRREEICVLYFFYYHLPGEEEPSLNIHPRKSLPQPEDGATPMDEEPASRKRDSVETRTVVLAPEKKRQRLAYVKTEAEFMRHWYYATSQRLLVQLDFAEEWKTGYDLMTATTRNFLMQKYDIDRKTDKMLFYMNYKYDASVVACLRTAKIYKVDEETNNFEDHEITEEMWPDVDKADESEVQQFVDEGAFKPIHRLGIKEDMVTIDCRWIRKRKRYPDKSIRIKSRLVARGCFDSQKQQLTTRSTTATRLSQRLLVSRAARRKENKLESWDIAGAFLKGFDFKKIQECLKKLGLEAPTRQVVVFPPLNVWRHLQKFSEIFRVPQHSLHEYGLLCLKPIYGLNDAPLAWQLSLHTYILELGAVRSKLDENCFYWKQPSQVMDLDNVTAMVTTHVDDLALTATSDWLNTHYDKFVEKYKKVTRQNLPFDHCGCKYSETREGYSISQEDFVSRIKPAPIPQREDDSKLLPAEVSDFRSILGALLWITATRLDIVADVSVLQSRVTIATVKELKLANEVLVKATECKEASLHYRRFQTPHQRLVCIHDASSANSGRHYAQEGILVCLADDHWRDQQLDTETVFDEETVKQHGGVMHVLHSHGGKAKRISYSTSHAETLSMVNGIESSTLVMVRLSEMMHWHPSPTIKELSEIQENGNPVLPTDCYMDCRDLFELCTGQKVLPQDKTQRLYVLGIRECRVTGRLRMISLVPTQSMTADALTKPMVSYELLYLLTTGLVNMFGVDNHPVVSRIIPSLQEYDEQTLMMDDEKILDYVKENPNVAKASHATVLFGLVGISTTTTMKCAMLFAAMTSMTAAQMINDEPIGKINQPLVPKKEFNYIGILMHYIITFMVVIVAILVEKYVFQLNFVKKLGLYVMNYVLKTTVPKVKVEIDDDDPMEVDTDMELKLKTALSELEDLNSYLDQVLKNRDHYKNTAEEALQKITTLENRVDELETELDNKRDEGADYARQRDAHALRLTNATAQAREKDNRIKDLKEQLQLMQQQMMTMQQNNASSGSLGPLGLHQIDMRVLRDELEAVKLQNKQYEEKIGLMTAESWSRDDFEAQIRSHEKTIETLRRQMSERPNVLSYENMQRDLENAKKKLTEQKQTIDNMSKAFYEKHERLQQASFPPDVKISPGGGKYHVGNCRHLKRAGKDIPWQQYGKCYDCCNAV